MKLSMWKWSFGCHVSYSCIKSKVTLTVHFIFDEIIFFYQENQEVLLGNGHNRYKLLKNDLQSVLS